MGPLANISRPEGAVLIVGLVGRGWFGRTQRQSEDEQQGEEDEEEGAHRISEFRATYLYRKNTGVFHK